MLSSGCNVRDNLIELFTILTTWPSHIERRCKSFGCATGKEGAERNLWPPVCSISVREMASQEEMSQVWFAARSYTAFTTSSTSQTHSTQSVVRLRWWIRDLHLSLNPLT